MAVTIGVLCLHLWLETVRWQMAPCFLVFFLTSVAVLLPYKTNLLVRIPGLLIGLLLISISGFYAHYMPIISLPPPSGNFSVGNTSLTLKDFNRAESHTNNPADFRELFVEIWYPAELAVDDLPVAMTLWRELYLGDSDVVSFFTGYLSGIETHSYLNLPPPKSKGHFPLILFNHGLQMFTSQNTLLMEELASNGYVVASIGHPYESIRVNLAEQTVLPKFVHSWENFKQALTWMENSSAPILAARDSIGQTTLVSKRIQIARNAVADSEMNLTVSEWVMDTKYVLDELLDGTHGPLPFITLIDTSRIGVMGMSIGGATAAELCKVDHRIKAGINIDGLLYGNSYQLGLKVPFLMIQSQDDTGLNEYLKSVSHNDYTEITFEQARHSDFTDMVYVWPIMKIYGQSGNIPAGRMIHLTNKVVLSFWDHYLKSESMLEWSIPESPELTIKKTSTLTRAPPAIRELHTSQ